MSAYNVWLPGLGAAAALSGTDPFATVQAGVTKKSTIDAVVTYILGAAAFTEKVQDILDPATGFLVAGTNVTLTYNDAGNTLTIAAAGGGGATVAAADPTTISDTAHGFAVGNFWFNTVTDVAYICRDATNAAAVWVNLATGMGPPGVESGAWLTAAHSTSGTAVAVANTHYATLFFLKQRTPFSRLGMYTDASAVGNCKAGFFTNKANAICPDVYVAGSETIIATSGAGGFASTAIGTGNITLDAGPWWMDVIFSGAPTLRGTGATDPFIVSLLGADTGNEVRQTSASANQTCRELAGSYATGLVGVSLATATRGPNGASGGAVPLVWAKMA